MASNRRMGPKDSITFNVLLDATEKVLHDQGYGAATSRRIAEQAGVRQQLVYYYFHTMDDLLLATFKRRTERALAGLVEEVAVDDPIQALWKFLTITANGRLSFEFMALANHHDGIRQEIAHYVVEARRIGARAIARQMDAANAAVPLSPVGLAFIMDGLSLLLRREEVSGITEGHAEALQFVKWALDRLSSNEP